MIQKLADELGLTFFETSAKNTSGINTVFSILADTIYENMHDGATESVYCPNDKFKRNGSVDLKKSIETIRLSFDLGSTKRPKKKQCCNP